MPAAIVLAGGRSRRFGGGDKLLHMVGERPLLAVVIEAARAAGATPIVLVGPPRPRVDDGCVVVREQPPGAGPLAAAAAGVGALQPEPPAEVFLLAGDLPHLDAPALRSLAAELAAAAAADAVAAVDHEGRLQPLVSIWRTARLRARLAELGRLADRPLRSLYDRARLHRIRLQVSDPELPPWSDLDYPGSAPGASGS